MTSLFHIANKINEMLTEYELGNLQELRKNIHSLSRVPSKYVFDQRGVKKDWGAHFGGRAELQFNIGFENNSFRYGVAFSLRPSRDHPNLNALIEKINLFNEYINEFGTEFYDLSMWHYDVEHDGSRSEDFQPTIIKSEWCKTNAFIFLGEKQNREKIDYQRVCDVLDRLLPLYLHIEIASNNDSPSTPSFVFKPGCRAKLSFTKASYKKDQQIDVRLLHNDLQQALYDELVQVYGRDNVGTENIIGCGRVDLTLQLGDKYRLYEIKTAFSAKSCIRQAIGQLLEYAYFYKAGFVEKLIVAGPVKCTSVEHSYLNELQNKFNLPIEYYQIKGPCFDFD